MAVVLFHRCRSRRDLVRAGLGFGSFGYGRALYIQDQNGLAWYDLHRFRINSRGIRHYGQFSWGAWLEGPEYLHHILRRCYNVVAGRVCGGLGCGATPAA